MTVVHIVLFAFKSTLSQDQVEEISKRMLDLENVCVHPKTGAKYVKSYGGGKNNSPEGNSKGATHGFVFEFENAEDRDYYLNTDPAHVAFKKDAKPMLDGVTVLDYTPGVH